jgi:pyruvate formate lyase activating enzyme
MNRSSRIVPISFLIVLGLIAVVVYTNFYSSEGGPLNFPLSREEALDAGLSLKEAMFYEKLEGQDVKCFLCPFKCEIRPTERGICRVRVNYDGTLYSLVYGKAAAVHVDPIEKKPVFHMLPGSLAFSVATAGCNLGCIFCQNWQLSQAFPENLDSVDLKPKDVVDAAIRTGSTSIAYTYSEPTVFYEYMLDTAKLAKERGIRNIWVTCAYIEEKPLRLLCKYLDAANVDLKGFSEKYYREAPLGSLQPVLDALLILKEEGVWIEITNLIVPTLNDDPEMIRSMCKWIVENLGRDVPVHFSRFHPNYKLTNLPPTPVKTLQMARSIALEEGINYVYLGNVRGLDEGVTTCPNCGRVVLSRVGFSVIENNLRDGSCRFCGHKIPGIWE